MSPSATLYSRTVPELGAFTSIVTLSVSICAMTSSVSALSPGALTSAATAPSVMESPICGTSIATGFEAALFDAGVSVSAAGADADAADAAATCAAAPSSISATACPTFTVSPSLTSTFVIVPATGDRTSIVTLSVSICATTSSTATASPGALSTAAMEPSVMESPICGTSTVDGASENALVANPREA